MRADHVFAPWVREGQGPEHSSARLERFCSCVLSDNIQVCIPKHPGTGVPHVAAAGP